MVTTDSILATEAMRLAPNIHQLSIAPLMAQAMQRISDESSVSSLFD
jgi:ribose-phosphate pyrophosphokinase